MNITFKKLMFKNFMSYGNTETVLEFNNKMNLITGKNGNGKTTAFIALFYALFGKSYKKSKLSSLINNVNAKQLYTEVEFSINQDNYRIVRGMKPNVFEIYKNEKLIPQNSTTAEYQENLETNILMFNENIFKQLIFLGVNSSAIKSFVELSKQEKEELFQTITDTAIFAVLKEQIKIKNKQLTTQETELTYKSQVLEEVIESEKANLEKIEKLNANILATSSQNKEVLISSIEELSASIEKYRLGIEKVKAKREGYLEKKALYETHSQEKSKTDKELRQINIELSRIADIKKTFSVCIGCSKLNDISSVDISKEEELQQKAKELGEKALLLDRVMIELDTEIKELTDIFNKAKSLKTLIQDKEQEIAKLNIQLQKIENTPTDITEVDYRVLEAKQLEQESIQNTLKDIRENVVKHKKLDKLFDNNNIKGLIIKQSLPLLNKYINEYLESFSDFNFKFEVKQDFSTYIKHNRSEYEFTSLSNGQSLRITFSIILAFLKLIETRNGVSTNILVADEILDSSLDLDGRMELLDILKRNFKNKSVYVISHNHDIINTEYFDENITIKRVNSFSKMSKE